MAVVLFLVLGKEAAALQFGALGDVGRDGLNPARLFRTKKKEFLAKIVVQPFAVVGAGGKQQGFEGVGLGVNFDFFYRKPAAFALVLRQNTDFAAAVTAVVECDFGIRRVGGFALVYAPLPQIGIRAVQGGGFVIVFEQAVCTQMQMRLGGGFRSKR